MRLEFCSGADLSTLAGRAISGGGGVTATAVAADAKDVARWLALDRPRRLQSLVDEGMPFLAAERFDAALGKAYYDGAVAARARVELVEAPAAPRDPMLGAAFRAGYEEFACCTGALSRRIVVCVLVLSFIILVVALGMTH